jgi:septum formation protein
MQNPSPNFNDTASRATPTLVLGSSSPYRRELLQRLRCPFEIARPDIDETPLPNESPADTALRLAEAKARVLAPALQKQYGDCLIIGSDQAADLNGKILGKAGDFERALQQLQAMRGQVVIFHTALCLLDTRSQAVQLVNIPTTVQLRELDDQALSAYLQAETPYDCAGSAKVESLGISLLTRCESQDPTALIGLPLISLCSMLTQVGYPILGR